MYTLEYAWAPIPQLCSFFLLLTQFNSMVLKIYNFSKLLIYMLKQKLTTIKVRNPKGPPLQARCPGETAPILEFNTIIAGPTYRGAKWA